MEIILLKVFFTLTHRFEIHSQCRCPKPTKYYAKCYTQNFATNVLLNNPKEFVWNIIKLCVVVCRCLNPVFFSFLFFFSAKQTKNLFYYSLFTSVEHQKKETTLRRYELFTLQQRTKLYHFLFSIYCCYTPEK